MVFGDATRVCGDRASCAGNLEEPDSHTRGGVLSRTNYDRAHGTHRVQEGCGNWGKGVSKIEAFIIRGGGTKGAKERGIFDVGLTIFLMQCN